LEEHTVRLEDLICEKCLKPAGGDALAVVDIQNDFIPGGALAVHGGDSIIPGINRIMEVFSTADLPVILTQDWHPSGHCSFASAHPGKKPYDAFKSEGLGPVLWPDHCVQGSPGAEFHRDLDTRFAQAVIRKGYHRDIDSYSGFLENDLKTRTGLDGYLKSRGVKRLFICGLALDYCVFFTAVDGVGLGYEMYVITDLARPVGSPPDSVSRALKTMTDKGVRFIRSADILAG
jgi:nicotinamidase/pyrazinamidase